MVSWLPLFAYVVSVIGSTTGLACTLRARTTEGGRKVGWLVLAAVSIGGVGIWVMHFIATLGFDTAGMPVRYDIARTTISALLAITAVFVGLVVFGVRERFSVVRLLLGGLIMGLAVNLVHYTGLWAVRVQGTISYNGSMVGLSIGIAVLAATMALLFTVLFDTVVLRGLAALIMGLTITALYYTTTATVTVRIDPEAPSPAGVRALTLLFPVLVLAVLALTIPIYLTLMTSTWSDHDDTGTRYLPANPPVPKHRREPPPPWLTTPTTTHVRGVAQFARQSTIPERQRSPR